MDIKQTLLLAAILLLPQMTFAKSTADSLTVVSYNIRKGLIDDGTNSWEYRREASPAMIADQHPDIFGLQEACDFQVEYLEKHCRGYKSVGIGREDGKNEGEQMRIFYKTSSIKLLKWGTFWLSETPDIPSRGWDAACNRTATWALLKDKKSGRVFYYVDTHIDHRGREAQKNGLNLIVDKIADINPEGYPTILTGDFNITPDDTALDELDTRMQSARTFALTTDSEGTYNGWGEESDVIDYIYYSGFSSCPRFQTITKAYLGRQYISDHFPVKAVLYF